MRPEVLLTFIMKNTAVCDVTQCNLLYGYQCLTAEDEGKLLINAATYILSDMTSYHSQKKETFSKNTSAGSII